MHVTFISSCAKNARKRTCKVLDSYAIRTGDSTWLTPINAQGLTEIYKELKKYASRHTSVACFRNDGLRRQQLQWIVGNKQMFNETGARCIARHSRKKERFIPKWLKAVALLGGAAGLMHDFGKLTTAFQKKLRTPVPVADAVRHEWISLRLVQYLSGGHTWTQAWNELKNLKTEGRWSDLSPFARQMSTSTSCLLYLIATHHKLPAMIGNNVSLEKHVRDCQFTPIPAGTLNPQIIKDTYSILDKIRKLDGGELYWRAVSTIARCCLILADHSVSSIKTFDKKTNIYANTDRLTGKLNQSLEFHLNTVGHRTSYIAAQLASFSPPSIPPETVELLLSPVPKESKFYWQQTASDALSVVRKSSSAPCLVLNMAGTGSGKTRMNVRALCALHAEGGLRFASAMNLRTLTLQTSDAYQKQLNLSPDMMCTVVGDKLAILAHNTPSTTIVPKTKDETSELLVDDDENDLQSELEVITTFNYTDIPDWLLPFAHGKNRLDALVGAPVLVSTIDFLVAAGEPNRQGKHALAMLRLATSDLILDEIDSYDPKAFLCVARLVTLSALWGKNVVASSATLSPVTAKLLWRAYDFGARMRASLHGNDNGTSLFYVAFVSDTTLPQISLFTDVDTFSQNFGLFVEKMLTPLKKRQVRLPKLIKPQGFNENSWLAAISDNVMELHLSNCTKNKETGQNFSLGLVRIANITTAIKVAKHLSKIIPQARVVCYHANLFPVQRLFIEKRLDTLLSRGCGDDHLHADTELLDCQHSNAATGYTDTLFIVVATPVEEIGRDHDFDWAVIEPSSVQSIIQTAGRVNRHRQISVNMPNIALLDYNYRSLRAGPSEPVFVRPGLEMRNDEVKTHQSRSLSDLLDWSQLSQVDARMRYNHDHLFSKADDDALERQTEDLFKKFAGEKNIQTHWMADRVYNDTPLREKEKTRFSLTLCDVDNAAKFYYEKAFTQTNPVKPVYSLEVENGPINTWLILNDKELINLANRVGLPLDSSLQVQLTGDFETNGKYNYIRNTAFGFCRKT